MENEKFVLPINAEELAALQKVMPELAEKVQARPAKVLVFHADGIVDNVLLNASAKNLGIEVFVVDADHETPNMVEMPDDDSFSLEKITPDEDDKLGVWVFDTYLGGMNR